MGRLWNVIRSIYREYASFGVQELQKSSQMVDKQMRAFEAARVAQARAGAEVDAQNREALKRMREEAEILRKHEELNAKELDNLVSTLPNREHVRAELQKMDPEVLIDQLQARGFDFSALLSNAMKDIENIPPEQLTDHVRNSFFAGLDKGQLDGLSGLTPDFMNKVTALLEQQKRGVDGLLEQQKRGLDGLMPSSRAPPFSSGSSNSSSTSGSST